MFKKQKRVVQGEIWINSEELVLPEGNTFYDALNIVLGAMDFDESARALCVPFYRMSGPGQPGTDPAVYFRVFLIGFFEGIRSERQIERRCADSIMLHRFLGYSLTERVPDHTAIGLFRRKIPEEVFVKVFGLVLPALARMGLFSGKDLGLDTSVIKANASMRNLRNRFTGQKYRDYVKRLATEAGIDPEDASAISRFDRTRKGRKTSNKEWENPFDPDAKIGPTKHGVFFVIKDSGTTVVNQHFLSAVRRNCKIGVSVTVGVREGQESRTEIIRTIRSSVHRHDDIFVQFLPYRSFDREKLYKHNDYG